MQMRSRRPAGLADVGDDLAGFDLLACGDTDAGAVRVQSGQPAAVVQLDVVTVTAAPTVQPVGDGHCAVGSRKDRRALWHRDVGTAVVADFAGNRVGTVSLRECDCARPPSPPYK